jgi:hypothetical protein
MIEALVAGLTSGVRLPEIQAHGVVADIATPRLIIASGGLPDVWSAPAARTRIRAPAAPMGGTAAMAASGPTIVHQHFAPGAFQLSIRDVRDFKKVVDLIEGLPSAARSYGAIARPRPV